MKLRIGGVRRIARESINRVLSPVLQMQATIARNQHILARELLVQRSFLSRSTGDPIRVIFLCHMRSLWGKVEPLVDELVADDRFDVIIVTAPHYHHANGHHELQDDGCFEFLLGRGYDPLATQDLATGHLMDIQALHPDFVFHSVPYDDQYPDVLRSDRTQLYSLLCYVPYYGIEIMDGEVLTITHPPSFYAGLRYAFVSSEEERELALKAHGDEGPFDAVVTGAPMLDAVFNTNGRLPQARHNPDKGTVSRVLWTPRWRVEEGTCHFEDYSEFLLSFAKSRPTVEFIFRPHPLLFNNFVNQGRITQQQVVELRNAYESMPNARIDESGSYIDTFLVSDILITDISSMMVEYFATGKPVIYTHRVNRFNKFGSKLAEGCYWVEDQRELNSALEQLLAGDDPLYERRQEIIDELLRPDARGATTAIKEVLLREFIAHEPVRAHSTGARN